MDAVQDQIPPRDEVSQAQQQRRLGHELRSTAQGLLGYLTIYQEEVQSRLLPEDAQLLERINYYAQKMADLSMDLLNEINISREK